MTIEELLNFYEQAKSYVYEYGYRNNCEYYGSIKQSSITEQLFLQEYAWVVLNSGFRESVVRKHWDFISLSFYDWLSAKKISSNADDCISLAAMQFNNKKKLESIVNGINIYLSNNGLYWVESCLKKDYRELTCLPFIGPITSKHLAKNLGVELAKPDRHLVTFAERLNLSVDEMCETIQTHIGDNIKLIDIVLWRYFSIVGTK